jgi:hypothetical protein
MLQDLDVIAVGSVKLQFFTENAEGPNINRTSAAGAGGASG